MAVQLSLWPKFQALTAAGAPLAGGKLHTYAAGTSTPLATYTDSTGGTPNANPVILNSRGEADVWLTEGSGYKLTLTDSADVTVWTVDNVLIPARPTAAQLLPSGVTLAVTSVVIPAVNGAATLTAAGFHPANVYILDVKAEVTQQFGASQGLVTFAVGDPGTIDRWLADSTTLTTGVKPTRQGGLPKFSSATDAVVTAIGGLFDGAGSLTLTRLTLTLA